MHTFPSFSSLKALSLTEKKIKKDMKFTFCFECAHPHFRGGGDKGSQPQHFDDAGKPVGKGRDLSGAEEESQDKANILSSQYIREGGPRERCRSTAVACSWKLSISQPL